MKELSLLIYIVGCHIHQKGIFALCSVGICNVVVFSCPIPGERRFRTITPIDVHAPAWISAVCADRCHLIDRATGDIGHCGGAIFTWVAGAAFQRNRHPGREDDEPQCNL